MKNLTKAEKVLSQKEQKISDLGFQRAHYKRLSYGQKRKRFEGNKDQMSLPLKMEAEKQEEQLKEKLSYERRMRTFNHQGRMSLPDHLPIEEIEIYPSEDISEMAYRRRSY